MGQSRKLGRRSRVESRTECRGLFNIGKVSAAQLYGRAGVARAHPSRTMLPRYTIHFRVGEVTYVLVVSCNCE